MVYSLNDCVTNDKNYSITTFNHLSTSKNMCILYEWGQIIDHFLELFCCIFLVLLTQHVIYKKIDHPSKKET